MASVNKVILIGNLGRDPETRYTTGGDAITNLNIATSEQWKDKSGEKQEKTEWHRVVLFGRQAEIAGEYLKKGRSVYIEGRLQTRKYTDKDGVEKYSTEIVGDRMQLLGSREGARRRRCRVRRRQRRAPAVAAGGGGGERWRRTGGGAKGRRRAQALQSRRPRRRHPVLDVDVQAVGTQYIDPVIRQLSFIAGCQSADATSSDARASTFDGTAITPPPRHTSPS